MADLQIRYKPLPTQRAFVESEAVVNVIYSNTGEGKSAQKGTPAIMFDGTIKKVEDIVAGDLLMGDDSTPRMVAGLARGQARMYEVIPVKGDSFTVNGPHILVLKRTNTTLNPEKNGEIVHISVDDYLDSTSTFKHLHKLYRVPVEFPEKPTPVDPYFLGIWLADGTHSNQQITTPDQEIIDYLQEYADEMGMKLSVDNKVHSDTYGYRITNGGGGQNNEILTFLRDYDLLGNKHIPLSYKTNSRENRLRLLAGLVDGDGWINHEGWQLIFKNETLANDVAFVARSLGLAAYIKPRQKTGFGITGTYFHVMISGDCACVPIKVERKKCQPRKQVKNPLMTGIKEIRYVGIDTYYGFTLDGNHRFLWGDFTVTHNTFGGIWGMLGHAQRCGKPIRCAIVRDTLENLKTSVVRSIEEFFQSSSSAFRFADGYKKLTIYLKDQNKKPLTITADLFGVDDPAALSKLQGPEYALIWLNEPAPISDSERLSAGLSEDVFNVALVRCARQKGTKARLQVDMNPADEDHWTHRRLIEEDFIDPENPLITKAVFRVPYGENIYVSEVSRQAVRAAYKDDEASYTRYVLGQFAKVYRGPAVTPTYNRSKHLCPSPLIPAPGLVSFAFFDSWSNPACVLGQITQYNRLIFIDTLRLDGSDIETLIETQVIPLLESPRWKGKSKAWRIGGDPTMTNMDQSSRLVSAAKKVEKYFGARFEKGPTEWRMVQNHILWALNKSDQRGEPMILLSADNKVLDKALAGGWHYHVNAQGNKTSTTPVKDEASHFCDAWAAAVCVLMPSKMVLKKSPTKYRELRQKSLRRAQTYAVQGSRHV